uniref:Uncharacterized protein n=1 Tax=Panagrolaimus superbus TaxID=310955 RepID=A0A914Z0Z8_9BILA
MKKNQEIDAGIFVKGKTHNIDPIGYGGAKDPATLQSNEPIRPKRNVGETNKLEYPIAIQWTIPEYRLMALKGNPSGHLSSASFNISKIPGLQYYIGISPNIIEEGTDQGETWIYLSLQNFGEKIIEANF